jgi:hypothetical protein
MGNFKIIGNGVSAVRRNSGMILWLWLIDLLFGIIVAAPVYFLVNKDFGHSPAGEGLGRLNFIWLGDSIYKYQDFLPALAGWVLVPALLFILISVFLNGGIIGRLAAGEKTTLQRFFADCGKYFGRFFRIFLLSLPVYVLVFGGLVKLVSAPFKFWAKNAAGEMPVIVASNLRFLMTILLLSIVQMYFDYVKIHLVVRDGRKVLAAAAAALSFIGRKFFKAWGLYLLVGLLFIATTAVFIAVTNVLPGTGGAALALGFIWAQAYILARIWIKVLFFAAELDLYRIFRP